MRTMNTVSTRSVPMVPSQMASPPPSRQELRDGGTVVGWTDGLAIGFRGFGDEDEAAHAAWVGYRTMSRRFARVRGRRPIPIDSEPLSLERSGDVELILAGGRPIATLVRPGVDGMGGRRSFGFELQLPVPADERRVLSAADLIYRTMRRSGIRWAKWMPAPPVLATLPTAGDESGAAVRQPLPATDHTGAAAGRSRSAGSSSLATVLIVLALLATIGLPAVTASALTPLLGGVAALLALVALVSLVHLVVTDGRYLFRQRGRGPEVVGSDHRPAAAGQMAGAAGSA